MAGFNNFNKKYIYFVTDNFCNSDLETINSNDNLFISSRIFQLYVVEFANNLAEGVASGVLTPLQDVVHTGIEPYINTWSATLERTGENTFSISIPKVNDEQDGYNVYTAEYTFLSDDITFNFNILTKNGSSVIDDLSTVGRGLVSDTEIDITVLADL